MMRISFQEADMQFEHNALTGRTEPTHLTGHDVVDAQLEKVGHVTDVIYEETVASRRWAVVKAGMFGREHFVPLDNAYLDSDDRLVVPVTKSAIKGSPRCTKDHVLTRETKEELRDYYGVAA